MLIRRGQHAPTVDESARVASTARLIGNVTVGPRAYIDHGTVIESAGPPVRIGAGAIVLANSVVRSVGGEHRPSFAVAVGAGTLISPLCALAGCHIGDDCYVATGVILLQGARVGAGTRVGARALVHAGAVLGEESRVGMGSFAVPSPQGTVVTADVEHARELVAAADFFGRAFGVDAPNQREVHRQAIDALRDELLEADDREIDP